MNKSNKKIYLDFLVDNQIQHTAQLHVDPEHPLFTKPISQKITIMRTLPEDEEEFGRGSRVSKGRKYNDW